MNTAEKIVRTFGSSISSASFLRRLPRLIKSRLLALRSFLKTHRPARQVVYVGLIALMGISTFFALHATVTWKRSSAENALLSLTMEERSAYVDDLEVIVRDNPESLQHLVGLDIFLLLDKPSFSRRDANIVVWQYKTPFCVLDIYLDSSKATDPISSPVVYQESRHIEANPFSNLASKNNTPSSKTRTYDCLTSHLEAARPGRTDRLLLSEPTSDI